MPIRPYRADDAPAIAQLFYDSVHTLGPRRYTLEQAVAWSPAPADPARWDAQFRDGRMVLVSQTDAGEVQAFAALERDGHLDHLYVRPDVAGTGVAGALLDAILALAEEQGMARVHTEASDLARGLLERRGFSVVERREFEIGGTMIWNWRMERSMRPDFGGKAPADI